MTTVICCLVLAAWFLIPLAVAVLVGKAIEYGQSGITPRHERIPEQRQGDHDEIGDFIEWEYELTPKSREDWPYDQEADR